MDRQPEVVEPDVRRGPGRVAHDDDGLNPLWHLGCAFLDVSYLPPAHPVTCDIQSTPPALNCARWLYPRAKNDLPMAFG
jgi:hypothetical protein